MLLLAVVVMDFFWTEGQREVDTEFWLMNHFDIQYSKWRFDN